MITESPTPPSQQQPKVVLPQGDQVFRIQMRWRLVALLWAFGVPYGIWWFVVTNDMIPNHFVMTIYQAVCLAIGAGGLFFFALTFQSLRVNQAGLQYFKWFSVRAMPWDEMLAYDVSISGNALDVMDIRGRMIHVNCNLYEYGMIDVLKEFVAGNRERAFEHIERRGLRCPVKRRANLAIFTLITSTVFIGVLYDMAQLYAPTKMYEVVIYNTIEWTCVFAALIAIYHLTSTILVDRFAITRRSLFAKTSISFSQVVSIRLWTRVLESDAPREMMDITGHANLSIRVTEYARNYKLLRDYVIKKSAAAGVVDER